jgi:hypothetical protein
MRSMTLLALGAGLLLLGSTAAWADGPHPINYNFHEPNDLIAYADPGPGPGADGTGDTLPTIKPFPGRQLGIAPPRPIADDPNAVHWPTLDESEWVKFKGSYNFAK